MIFAFHNILLKIIQIDYCTSQYVDYIVSHNFYQEHEWLFISQFKTLKIVHFMKKILLFTEPPSSCWGQMGSGRWHADFFFYWNSPMHGNDTIFASLRLSFTKKIFYSIMPEEWNFNVHTTCNCQLNQIFIF